MKWNLGCGFDIKEGWFNTNYFSHIPVDGAVYLDALEEHEDMKGEFDFILVNHVLCTMKDDLALRVLRNCRAALVDGGTIQVIDMDLLKVFKSYEENRLEDLPISEGDFDDRLCLAISGYGTRNSLYTCGRMHNVLTEAGFHMVNNLGSSEFDTRPKESLVFEAIK
jgi:hypothetical protein